MAPPKGHSYANGHGRPREHDYIALAEDLLKWSLREDALSIYGWTDDKTFSATELVAFAEREPYFAEAYKKAKERVGLRRERGVCSKEQYMNYGCWARSAWMYDPLLKMEEKAKSAYEAELSAKAAQAVPQETISSFIALNDQLTKYQEENRKKIPEEHKSKQSE